MFKSPGFTIVELSITLVIIIIMSVIAIPLYHQFMASAELKNTPRVLTIHIQKAKLTRLLGIQTLFCVPVPINSFVIRTGIVNSLAL